MVEIPLLLKPERDADARTSAIVGETSFTTGADSVWKPTPGPKI
jgi:hypothetical protein